MRVSFIINKLVILHISATSYPSFVIHLQEDRNKADRNMWEYKYPYNKNQQDALFALNLY